MAEVDCRIIAMLALALSLLSLAGLIFTRHHHHHSPSAMSLTSENIESIPSKLELSDLVINEPTEPFESNETSTPSVNIDEHCLQCICEATSDCKPSKCSGGEICGLYRISQPYWIDAGKPTLHGENLDNDGDTKQAYLLCVNDPVCAARTVSDYTGKYRRDCDGDGMIDCYDYAAIHIQGPSGCMLDTMPPVHNTRFEDCYYNEK